MSSTPADRSVVRSWEATCGTVAHAATRRRATFLPLDPVALEIHARLTATARRPTGGAGMARLHVVAAAFVTTRSPAPSRAGTVSGRRKDPMPLATGAVGVSPTASGAPGRVGQAATRLGSDSGTTKDGRQGITGKILTNSGPAHVLFHASNRSS